MVFRELGDVRIDIVVQPATDRDPDPLNDMVACHVDRVTVMRKYLGGGAGPIDFLDRHHIGVQLLRVCGEASEVFVGAGDRRRAANSHRPRAWSTSPGSRWRFSVPRIAPEAAEVTPVMPVYVSTSAVPPGSDKVISGYGSSDNGRAPQSVRNWAMASNVYGSCRLSAESPSGTQMTVVYRARVSNTRVRIDLVSDRRLSSRLLPAGPTSPASNPLGLSDRLIRIITQHKPT